MTRKLCKVKFFKAPKKKNPSSYFIMGINAIASGIQTIWSIQKTQILYFAKHSMSMPVTSWSPTMKHRNWLLWGTLPGPSQPNSSEPECQTTTANYNTFPVTSSMSRVLSAWVLLSSSPGAAVGLSSDALWPRCSLAPGGSVQEALETRSQEDKP